MAGVLFRTSLSNRSYRLLHEVSPLFSACLTLSQPTHQSNRGLRYRVNTLLPNLDNPNYTPNDSIESKPPKKSLWLRYNEVVYPPRRPDEPERPAEVTKTVDNIQYSQKTLFCLAHIIRGLSVEEALKQLAFKPLKGARIIEQAIYEAVEDAVKYHNVEFSTNLWVETTNVVRSDTSFPRLYKGLRRQQTRTNYHYSCLHIRLREGKPPKYYHPSQIPSNGYQKMEDHLKGLRNRKIFYGL